MNDYIKGLQYRLPHSFRKTAEHARQSFYENACIDENGIVVWN